MTSQMLVLVLVGVLVLLALVAAVALYFTPGRRAARRARTLEEAEQAERMRHDPQAPADPEGYRWEVKRAENIHDFPGGMGGI
jgi:hypothetical protein